MKKLFRHLCLLFTMVLCLSMPITVLADDEDTTPPTINAYILMTEISDRFNDDLIIIPSSIHECIVIPSRSAEIPNLDSLNEIINSVNANELTPDEILSDKAYGYDKNTHELIHADQLSVFKSVEQTLEQNDNMLDGIINNGANAREIPGTYDEAEREADELTRAKKLISEYSKDEFGNEPDFSDLKSIGLAYTTIDNFEFLKEAGVENFNKEFEIQVDANLIDNEIITYIDGDEISTEKFESLADMLPTLESLNFNDLIHLGSEGWEKIAESELNREAQEALDAHEAEFGADGSRVFPHLNDEPEDKTDVFLYPEHTNDDTKAISDFLSDKGIDYRFVSVNNADVVRIDRENLNTLTEILANRDINFAIEPEEALAIQIDQLNRDFDTYAYDDNVESRNEAVSERGNQ